MMTKSGVARDEERRLTRLYRSLSREDRRTLLRFAAFLASDDEDGEAEEQPLLEPELAPRPAKESVVAAIKRLSRGYHMLDRSAMLNETSTLMAAHVLHGRSAKDVIDELETLFARYYADYRGGRGNDNGRPR
jgi:hypothetical protein